MNFPAFSLRIGRETRWSHTHALFGGLVGAKLLTLLILPTLCMLFEQMNEPGAANPSPQQPAAAEP